MKIASDGVSSLTEERISELQDLPMEILKTKKQREQTLKKIPKIKQSRNEDNYKRCNIHAMDVIEEERERNKRNIWNND